MPTQYTKVTIPTSPWTSTEWALIGSASATRIHLIQSGELCIRDHKADYHIQAPALIWMAPGPIIRSRCISPIVERITLHLTSGAWAPAHQADADAIALRLRLNQIANAFGPILACTQATIELLDRELSQLAHIYQHPEIRHHRSSLKAGAMRVLALLDDDPLLQAIEIDERADTTLRATERIEAALHHLEQRNYISQEQLTVSDLARLCGYRPSRFHALFVEATGLTPQRYLTRRRIALACELLGNHQQTVLDVAFECGFSSQSRFYHAFNTVMGTSPAKWRRQRYHTKERS